MSTLDIHAGGKETPVPDGFLWPGGKRIAVFFRVSFEWWSDGKWPGIGPMGNPLRAGVPDLNAVAWAEYVHRRGIHRILEVLARQGVKATINVSGIMAERYPTIHGLISGRLDRLERETKRILQEASVIGRAFLYDILKRITELDDLVDTGLNTLERLDFIRTRSLQPELEYMFKHPLTQEVVYNGLLRKERQDIHEQIALVMEQLFQERLPEFYETLAFHYRRGRSAVKAVEYLILSGRKSLSRYAVEEADQYLRGAFDILKSKTEKTDAEKMALIDVINDWGFVFYYLGNFNKMVDVMNAPPELAESLGADARLGMIYALLGVAHFMGGRPSIAFNYLKRALELGESCRDQKVIGYACTWLTFACVDLARFDQAATYGEKAQEIAPSPGLPGTERP